MSWDWNHTPYVSAAEKRRRSEKAAKKLAKDRKGDLQPIRIEGRLIANSFWGKSWCQNLESYSDYSNRLPRGRSYVRNGSVLDLQLSAGMVTAAVSGSSLYRISIKIAPVKTAVWKSLKTQCSGRVGSLLDLLQGKLSAPVMEIMTQRESGLFPKPAEIELGCSCPDWADMCKHVAAVLYGVGARLDHTPELLFVLRGVDHLELVTEAAESVSAGATSPAGDTIASDSLADVFGIELETTDIRPAPAKAKPKKRQAAPAAKPGRISKSTKANKTAARAPSPKPAAQKKRKAAARRSRSKKP